MNTDKLQLFLFSTIILVASITVFNKTDGFDVTFGSGGQFEYESGQSKEASMDGNEQVHTFKAGDYALIDRHTLAALDDKKEAFHEMEGYIKSNNEDAINEMIAEGALKVLKQGIKVRVLESDDQSAKVTILDTEEIGWVYAKDLAVE